MNDEKEMEKQIELKKRTPGERKAFVQGFEHAVNMFSYHLIKKGKYQTIVDMKVLLHFLKDEIKRGGDEE